MSVTVGSARSSYGDTSAGDQNGGKEVSTQSWYLHGKGWVVLRCKDAARRTLIAEAMQKACDNNDIGYSQGSRDTLYANIKGLGFDPSKTTKAVNTDCSALVRVCCCYAGIKVGNFTTSSEKKTLMATGQFDCLTEDKYCKSSDYLMKGDILVTKAKGHTVVVLTDGKKAEDVPAAQTGDGTNAVTVSGNSVNVRYGPGTNYGIAKVVNKGDTLEKVEITGWTPVKVNGQVMYISVKFVK